MADDMREDKLYYRLKALFERNRDRCLFLAKDAAFDALTGPYDDRKDEETKALTYHQHSVVWDQAISTLDREVRDHEK